jgi:hypothetical protein
MRSIKYALITALAIFCFSMAAPKAQAQVSFGINIGAEPVCPYGYYGYAPYNCAPYGYYSDDWFNGGAFIGAGRWYRGGRGFYGHVNRSFDPRYGYHGGFPEHGGYHEPDDHFHNFHANNRADVHGQYHGDDHSHGTPNDHAARGGGNHGGGHDGGGRH